MFTNPVIERDTEVVPIHNIDPDVLRSVIGFIYTGELEVTNENAQDLMAAGSMFDLPHLIGLCTDHMTNEICLSNCIELYLFASHFSSKRLKENAKHFILEHFTELVHIDENKVLDLDFNVFDELMSEDDLSIEKEEILFDVLVKWAAKDAVRGINFHKLFKNIRLPLINEDYMRLSIQENQFVKDCPVCQQVLRKYWKFVAQQKSGEVGSREDNIYSYLNTTPRNGMYQKPMLVFSSGTDRRDDRSLTSFDPVTFKNYVGVKPHPTFDFKFKIDYYQLVTVCENQIFFLGGIFYDDYHFEDAGSSLSDVYQYNIKIVKWEKRANMQTPRCCFAVAVVGRNIYAVGGKPTYPRGEPTDSLEVFHTEHDSWTTLSPLPIKIYAHACATDKDAIFVFGGKDEDDEFLDTVFRYDIRCDSWSLVTTQLPKPRAFCSAFAYKHKLYVFGGMALFENILFMSVYDPVQNKWSFGEDFPEERRITSAGFHDGNIFVCGGVRILGVSGRRSRQVESRDLFKYDIENNRWSKVVKLVQYGNIQSMTFAVLNTKHLTESDFISSL